MQVMRGPKIGPRGAVLAIVLAVLIAAGIFGARAIRNDPQEGTDLDGQPTIFVGVAMAMADTMDTGLYTRVAWPPGQPDPRPNEVKTAAHYTKGDQVCVHQVASSAFPGGFTDVSLEQCYDGYMQDTIPRVPRIGIDTVFGVMPAHGPTAEDGGQALLWQPDERLVPVAHFVVTAYQFIDEELVCAGNIVGLGMSVGFPAEFCEGQTEGQVFAKPDNGRHEWPRPTPSSTELGELQEVPLYEFELDHALGRQRSFHYDSDAACIDGYLDLPPGTRVFPCVEEAEPVMEPECVDDLLDLPPGTFVFPCDDTT